MDTTARQLPDDFYRGIVDSIDAVWAMRSVRDDSGSIVDFRYEYANAAALGLLGEPEGNVVGHSLLEVYPSSVEQGLFESFRHATDWGETVSRDFPWFEDRNVAGHFEVVIRQLGDGCVAWAREVTTNAQGEIADITDHPAAAQAPEASDDRYRVVAENSSDVVFVTGPDQRVTWVAPSVTRTLGWSPEELVGTVIADLVHPEDRGSTDSEDRQNLGVGTDHVPRESLRRLRTWTGDYLWMSGTVRPVLDDTGRTVMAVVGLRNVDELVRSHEVVTMERERVRALMDSELDPRVSLWPVRDAGGQIIDFESAEPNPAACEFFGRTREQMSGKRIGVEFSNFVSSGMSRRFAEVIETGRPLVLDDVSYRDDTGGIDGWFDIRAVRAGQVLSMTWRDVSGRHRAQAALDAATEDLRAVLESSGDSTMRFDRDLRMEYVNVACAELSGIPVEEWAGKTLLELGYPEDRVSLWNSHARRAFDTGETHRYEFEVDNSKGHRWYEASLVPQRDPDGAVAHVVSTNRDVTDRHIAEDHLRVMATHDPLTGLANRVALFDEITRALHAGRRSGRSTAVLMVDLDHFKNLNDSLGHEVGDGLLRDAARRLEALVRGGDLVAHPGGDEFVVVMRDLDDPTVAVRLASRIVEAFRGPFGNDHELYTTASIGISISSPSAEPGEMMREADIALHRAKEEGRDRVAVYDDDLSAVVDTRLSLEGSLRHALEREELAVWYQPEVDLTTGKVVAVEALLRWHHPGGELFTADRFIDVAEDSGLILDIGDWVLQEACNQGAAWATAHPDRPIVVRVNLSVRQLARAGLLGALDGALASTSLDPSRLCVEITETALLPKTPVVHDNLAGVRSRGIRIAVDDFGTGYASLSYLRDNPVDVLKIDQSFITNMGSDEFDRGLVAGVLALAARIGIEVTAEGVEHQAEADLLRSMGCVGAQGFLYSKAVPPAEIDPLLDINFLPPPWTM